MVKPHQPCQHTKHTPTPTHSYALDYYHYFQTSFTLTQITLSYSRARDFSTHRANKSVTSQMCKILSRALNRSPSSIFSFSLLFCFTTKTFTISNAQEIYDTLFSSMCNGLEISTWKDSFLSSPRSKHLRAGQRGINSARKIFGSPAKNAFSINFFVTFATGSLGFWPGRSNSLVILKILKIFGTYDRRAIFGADGRPPRGTERTDSFPPIRQPCNPTIPIL